MNDLLATMISAGEEIKVDRINISLQLTGNGEANAVATFIIDQKASYTLSKETQALRQALSQPLFASGNENEISVNLSDALGKVTKSAKYAVDRYRKLNNASDVEVALIAAVKPMNESSKKAGAANTDSTSESENNMAAEATISEANTSFDANAEWF